MLEEGEKYAVMLYTWRSCSRAVPSVSFIQSGSYVTLVTCDNARLHHANPNPNPNPNPPPDLTFSSQGIASAPPWATVEVHFSC